MFERLMKKHKLYKAMDKSFRDILPIFEESLP
jgi:hypothetical protein